MRKYYQDMSNGALNLTIDVRGPYMANKAQSYYGANTGTGGSDAHPGELVGYAIDQAAAAGVDFSQYDNDNDGTVDIVTVIHAGRGEESSKSDNDIWSHAWDLASAKYYSDGAGNRKYNGKTISKYTIQPEYNSTAGDSTIGVFCHEFGHVLGLPDMYDTEYQTYGVGKYTLMAGGSWLGATSGARPAPFLAWEKRMLGWLTTKLPDGTVVADAGGAREVMLASSPKTAGRSLPLIPILALSLLGLGGFFSWRRRDVRIVLLPLFFALLVPSSMVFLASCSDDDAAVLIASSSSSAPVSSSSALSTESAETTSSAVGSSLASSSSLTSANAGSSSMTASSFSSLANSSSSLAPGAFVETFDNYPETGSSYVNGSFTGVNSIVWSFTLARGDQALDGKAVCLKGDLSATLPSGVASVSFKLANAFTDVPSVTVWAGETQIGTSYTTAGTYSISSLAIAGPCTLTFKTGNQRATIDTVTIVPSFIVASSSSSISSLASSSSSLASSSSSSSPPLISLVDIETSHTAIKIPLGDSQAKQYYLVENKRRVVGTWTEYLPGDGLLICHIHDGVTAAFLTANAVNDTSTRIHGVNVIEADNNSSLWGKTSQGQAGDLFKSRSFTPSTSPATKRYTATSSPWNTTMAASGVYLENISAVGATMTFSHRVE